MNPLLFVSGEAFLDSDRTAIGLVVLDVGLPGMDGFSVCQKVREKSSVPLLCSQPQAMTWIAFLASN